MNSTTPPKPRRRAKAIATGARARQAKAQGAGVRKYTLSPAALAQRRAASPSGTRASLTQSTGPRTEAGKAASSRNNWRHGEYSAVHLAHRDTAHVSVAALSGKPCRSTCPVHPDNPERTEAPCSLVVQGLTQAGGNCLDKTRFLQAYEAITSAAMGDSDEAVRTLMASEVASGFQLLDALKRSVAADGVLVRIPAIDKLGGVVYDRDGAIVYRAIHAHPGLAHIAKYLEVLGVSLPELLATPKSKAAKGASDDLNDTLQGLLGGIHQRATLARQSNGLPALEHEAE